MGKEEIGGTRRTHPVNTDTSAMPLALLVSLADAASLLSVSRWTIYQLINRRELVAVRIDRRRLIARIDLEAYIDKLRTEESPDGR